MKMIVVISAVVVLVLLLRVLTTRGETLRAKPTYASPGPLTDDSVRELVLLGRKIEAIKAYRTLHGVDLKDAKHAVERLAETLPSASSAA